jgi:tRNA A-37 threonylcarbamoyl transferase component Bud32
MVLVADDTRNPRGDRRGGSVDLPLPPPEEDDARAAAVRFTADLTNVGPFREQPVPTLPFDTAPFQRVDAPELAAARARRPSRVDEDEHTLIDPPSQRGAPAPATALPLAPPRHDARPAARRSAPTTTRRSARPSPQPTDTGLVLDESTAVAADPLAPLRSPLIGGRYRMVARIGEGGMGKVFKVTHAQLGKTFALKIIHAAVATDEKARESFFREAQVASSLAHPNIASVVDFGEDRQYGAFMVMEFLEGEVLAALVARETRLGIRHACDIMLQIAEALHYIHSHRIVHCDIKAENIMLCEFPGTKRRTQQVKLLDFGLARSTTTAQRFTGSLSGTPHYVAPERIRGEPPGPQADIYGLGILFHELLSGSVPWDGNVAQILCGHLEKLPPTLADKLGQPVDPALEQLIGKALKKLPEERHRDTSAFIYELRTVMDMLGFGRRGKRAGTRQKIVVERATADRDAFARAAFDANRLPMAVIAASSTIVAANAAFAKFVLGVAEAIEGIPVHQTPLAAAWDDFDRDLGRACGGELVRRVIELDTPEGEIRKLLLWLQPAPIAGHACFGIHPIDVDLA